MSDTYKPDFATPEQIKAICEEMQAVEDIRAADRALIDNLMNGGRPYTPKECKKYHIDINVNWNEGSNILQNANGQLNNALIFKPRLFTATCLNGKPEKREEFSKIFTDNIHRPLKRGRSGKRHMNLLKSRNASVTLHGIGAIVWLNTFRWMGRYIPLEDLLIPTDTLSDFSNLNQFCINLYLTLGEFFTLTHGKHVDKRWNMDAVHKILDDLSKPTESKTFTYSFMENPEKRIEQFKQNRCWYESDAAPTVKLRAFFYRNPDTDQWYRCVVLREGTQHQQADADFIYDGRDDPFAENLDRIIHVQYGDNSLCPPLKHHATRGLGVMLYAPIECNNRVRCETVQHVLLNLKTLLRISNPVDRDRPKILELAQYAELEDGVSIIPNTERHQIDPRLVEFAQSQMRQLMSENSANYVQNIRDGTGKQPDRTATETNAIVQSVNTQVSNTLQSGFEQETSYYEELKRRFLDPNSDDDEVKSFQARCKKDGIPDELMVPENWQIDIERVLGAGDHFVAAQEANALLSQSQRFDPTAQRKILKSWVYTMTRDASKAELLVPSDPHEATAGTIAAEDVFGTLMQGIPASIRQGIERTQYIESLIGMMGSKVQQIQAIDNMGTPQEVIGLKTVADHIGKNLQILEPDKEQKQRLKLYSDELGKLMNVVKGFEQRQMEARQAQSQGQQGDPKAAAAAQAIMLKAQVSAQAKETATSQRERHREIGFYLEQARKDAQVSADLNREQLAHRQQLIQENLTRAVEAFNSLQKPTNGEEN